MQDGRLIRLRIHLLDQPGALADLTQSDRGASRQHRRYAHNRAYYGVNLGDTAIDITLETRGREQVEELLACADRRRLQAQPRYLVTLALFVVEVQLLLAGDGLAVAVGGVEGPLPYRGDHRLVDGAFDALYELQFRDLAGFVDGDVDDDVASCSARQAGEIWLGAGEVLCQRDVDIARAKRVGSAC